jgi:hypothetical protein
MPSKRLGFLLGAALVFAGGRFTSLFSQTTCYIRLVNDYISVSYTGASYVDVDVTSGVGCQWWVRPLRTAPLSRVCR